MTKMAEQAAVACYAAIAAGVTAIAAATNKTAEMGNEFAKTSRTLGITAETFQELQYVANQSGISDITPRLEKMNKAIIDVKNGTGSLTDYLKLNDAALLDQLQNVDNNEQVFMLLMNAIDQAPDSYSKAEIATLAFGKAGLDMINVANGGTGAISELREEARKYGIITNETCAASEEYSSAQTRLKASLQGVVTELTSKFIPGATQVIDKVANLIAGVDDWGKVLDTAIYILAGATAGLTAFLIVTKGAQMVQTFTTAVKALNVAVAANPFGAIAVVVTAILIPALIYLIKNWDTVQTYLQQGIARIDYAFNIAGSKIKEVMTVAFAGIKAAAATLLDFIVGNVIRGIGTLLETASKIPIVGDQFKKAAESVNKLGNAIGNMATEARAGVTEAINNSKAEQQATEAALKAKLEAIDNESRARREDLNKQSSESNEKIALTQNSANQQIRIIEDKNNEEVDLSKRQIIQLEEIEKQKNDIVIKSLQDRLKEVEYTENQSQNEQIEIVSKFLRQRADLEKVNGKERIAFFNEQKEILLSNESAFGNEKVAIVEAVNKLIENTEQEISQKRLTELEKREREEIRLTKELESEKTEEKILSLKERLNAIEQTEAQSQNEQINIITQFLNQRADLEGVYEEDRIEFFKQQRDLLLSQETEFGNEWVTIDMATNKLINKIELDMADKRNKEIEKSEKEKNQIVVKSLSERLRNVSLSENQIKNEQIDIITQFLEQRAELEGVYGEERIAFYEEQKILLLQQESEFGNERVAIIQATNKVIANVQKKALTDRIKDLYKIQADDNKNSIQQLTDFFLERSELESEDFNQRLAFLEEQKTILLSQESEFAGNRIEIEESLNKAIKKIQEDLKKSEQETLQARLGNATSFFQNAEKLLKAFGVENIVLAGILKGLAIAEATINTALGVTSALARGDLISAAAIGIAGAAEIATIISTMIPGGNNPTGTVPNFYSGGTSGSSSSTSYGGSSGASNNVTPGPIAPSRETYTYENFLKENPQLKGGLMNPVIAQRAYEDKLRQMQEEYYRLVLTGSPEEPRPSRENYTFDNYLAESKREDRYFNNGQEAINAYEQELRRRQEEWDIREKIRKENYYKNLNSSETGGRFIVPNNMGVDNVGLRVNSGEQIDVTPRGETGMNESFNFNFVIDGSIFAEIINRQARRGELYTLQLASNY